MIAVPSYVSRERGAAELDITPEIWDAWVTSGRLPPPAPGGAPDMPRWRWADVEARMANGPPPAMPSDTDTVFDEDAEYSLWRDTRDVNAKGYRKAGWQVRVEPNDGAVFVRQKKTDPWIKLHYPWANQKRNRIRYYERKRARVVK